MEIRKATEADLRFVTDNFELKGYELPDTEGMQSYVVEHEGKLIGFGFIRPILETGMGLTDGISLRLKVEALDKIVALARQKTAEMGYPGSHAFITAEEYFSKLLKKHYGFKAAKGECLYLEV